MRCCIRKRDSEVVLRRVSVIPCSSVILILKLNREGREGRVRKEKFALGDEEDARRNGTLSPRCCSVESR